MSNDRLGLELTPRGWRGVRLSPWGRAPRDAFELDCDPRDPAACVSALQAAQAQPASTSLALGMGFLEVARVALPPAPDDAREAMVALDPERFLGTEVPQQTALVPGTDLALGADRAWLEQLLRALEAWAPVFRVESAAVAVAATGCPDGTYRLDDAVIEIQGGRLAGVRRGNDPGGASPPPLGAIDGRYRAAWGALCRSDASPAGSLMDAPRRLGADRRRWQSMATAALGAAAAFLFLVAGVDRARARTLAAFDAEATRLTAEAGPALAAFEASQAASRGTQLATEAIATRSDHATTLARLATVLPRGVVLTALRTTGADWQVEGTARDATALVPLLDADPHFDQVRSLSASTRFRDGNTTRESFSITFRVIDGKD